MKKIMDTLHILKHMKYMKNGKCMEVNKDRYNELCSMDKGDLILYIILLEQEFNINMEIEDIYRWIKQEMKGEINE